MHTIETSNVSATFTGWIGIRTGRCFIRRMNRSWIPCSGTRSWCSSKVWRIHFAHNNNSRHEIIQARWTRPPLSRKLPARVSRKTCLPRVCSQTHPLLFSLSASAHNSLALLVFFENSWGSKSRLAPGSGFNYWLATRLFEQRQRTSASAFCLDTPLFSCERSSVRDLFASTWTPLNYDNWFAKL